jgi:Ankyrin repeats (many copies)
MAEAARQGHLAVCHYLAAEQCPCDASACVAAAAGGHYETVRFLHESGCPWDSQTMCQKAAESGSVELLQYLKQQECAFSEQIMSIAAQRGLLHVCQYFSFNGMAWSPGAVQWAEHEGCASAV